MAKDAAGRRATGSARTAAGPLVRPLVAVLAALAAVFWAHGPALQSPFVFDDTGQQFALPSAFASLSGWIGLVRPVLMFTYWVNTQIVRDPYSFHVFNALLRCITAALIFAIVHRLLTRVTARPVEAVDGLPLSPLCCSSFIRRKPNPSPI